MGKKRFAQPYPSETVSVNEARIAFDIVAAKLSQMLQLLSFYFSLLDFGLSVLHSCIMIHFMSFPEKTISEYFKEDPKINFIWLYLKVFFMPWRSLNTGKHIVR